MPNTPPSPLLERFLGHALWKPFADRDFRLLWLGESVSLLGDQFYLVAVAWLALRLSGSGLALGLVLASAAVPRALFVLAGGAVTDRFSPRVLMLASNAARAALAGAVAILIGTGSVRIWHLYCFSAAFGTVDAFFYPAFMSIVPLLVKTGRIEAGNALLRGTARLSVWIGPAPAGILISAGGLTSAFAVDCATFLFSAAMLWMMNGGNRTAGPRGDGGGSPGTGPDFGVTVLSGLRYVGRTPILRTVLMLAAVVEFSFAGPFLVGLAGLAKIRFGGEAVAYGLMLSAWGAGALAGALTAGATPRAPNRGRRVLVLTGAMGTGLILMAAVPNLPTASVVLGLIGFGSGLINVMMISWLQERAEPSMLGRVMSLAMLSTVIAAPLSYALAGLAVDRYAGLLFVAAGGLVLVSTGLAAIRRDLSGID